MSNQLMKNLERMLQEASDKRLWGCISIDLKDGRPFLVKHTIQLKPEEDYPYVSTSRE
jgi:hypothetical protein